MSIQNFCEPHWIRVLQNVVHANMAFGAALDFVKPLDARHFGDKVQIPGKDISVKPYIPDREDSPEEAVLCLEHGAYYNLYVNNVDALQNDIELMEQSIGNTACKLAEDAENYILSIIHEKAMHHDSVYMRTNWQDIIMQARAKADKYGMPEHVRCLFLPVDANCSMIKRRLKMVATGGELKSYIGHAKGFEVYVSPVLYDEMVISTPDSMLFTGLVTHIEAYKLPKGFSDGVKGLALCGAAVVKPENLCVMKIVK